MEKLNDCFPYNVKVLSTDELRVSKVCRKTFIASRLGSSEY